MTSSLLVIAAVLGTLPGANGVTVDSPSFNWANVNNKSFISPFDGTSDAMDAKRCWEYGINIAAEGAIAAQFNNPDYHLNLSEQITFACAFSGSETCDSMSNTASKICSYVTSEGFLDEKCSPWKSTSTITPGSCSSYKCGDSANRKIVAQDCDYEPIPNKTVIKDLLINHGPLAVSMNFFPSLKNYKSGVYKNESGEESIGTYLVTITGWESGEKGLNFILRNNWGENWGSKGYFKVAADDLSYVGCSSKELCLADHAFYFDFNPEDLPGYPCISTNSLDFGDFNAYSGVKKSFTISNCGNSKMNWSASYASPLVVTPPSGSMNPGDEITVEVTFDPQKIVAGKFSQAIKIQSQASYDSQINVTANLSLSADPVVSFTANPPAGYAPLEVTFTNTTKGDNIESVSWDFGEKGISSTKANPTYIYVAAGDYDVTLTVKTKDGKTFSKKSEKLIAVYTPANKENKEETKEVKTGCSASGSADLLILCLLAIFLIILPQKRLN